MEVDEKHSLLQPLNTHHQNYDNDASNNTKLFLSDNTIIHRILLVLCVAIISIWANYEASKTFDITIVNDIKDSPAGRRFTLFYVSNDKATRIVLNTSSFVEHLLYPNNNNNNNNNKHYPKKRIESVTLRLTRRNLNTTTAVSAAGKNFNGYVIDISPMLVEDENYDKMAIVGAVQRAMARVWLWDGGSMAPIGLLDGMAEYVAELAGFRRERVSGDVGEFHECEVGRRHGMWWEDKDPSHVARFLHYCEKYRRGFIQRLNEAMRDTWHDRIVDDVLGMPAMKLCGLYNSTWRPI